MAIPNATRIIFLQISNLYNYFFQTRKTIQIYYLVHFSIYIMDHLCPICLDDSISIFTNVCNHSWCKACHERLLAHNHTECVICRHAIILPTKYRERRNFYIEWLLSGGEPVLRWRPKRYRRGRFHDYKY